MTQIDSREFRNALGQFATGVTVVTTRDSEGSPVGMTANSFSSLSLEPPLVLWSIAKTSSNYATFVEANTFAIHIMNSDQQDLCTQFASKEGDRFDGITIENGLNNVPLLQNALARFECTTEHRYEGGDHLILVGRVERFEQNQGEALLFYKGAFKHIA